MIEQYLLYICLSALIAQNLGRTYMTIGSSLYDIRRANMSAIAQKSRKGRRNNRPLITILVYAENSETAIQDCLRSVYESSYPNHQLIVIDNASTDKTKLVAAACLKPRPKRTYKLLSKRKRLQPAKAYLSVERYIRGKAVLFLKADETLHPQALHEIASHYANGSTAMLLTNVQMQQYPSFFVLVRRFDLIVQATTRKSRTLITGNAYDMLGSKIVYNWPAFRVLKQLQNRNFSADELYALLPEKERAQTLKMAYESRAIVHIPPDVSWKRFASEEQGLSFESDMTNLHLTGWHQLLDKTILRARYYARIFEPFMVTYFFFLAYTGLSSTLLIVHFAAFSVWMTMNIWTSEHMSSLEKTTLSLRIPMLYLFSYIRNVLSLLCLGYMAVRFDMNQLFRILAFMPGRPKPTGK